jgi:preprotein translocase SecE subunit
MARDRQKAKRRQAERRAKRLAERGAPGQGAPVITGDPEQDALLAAGSPPQDEGSTEQVVRHEPPPPPDLGDGVYEDELAPAGRADSGEEHHERGRVMDFLVSVWAELKRVEWPDRQTLTTLTGVVLGFVIIAGGYLGLLDAIFSRLVQAIL